MNSPYETHLYGSCIRGLGKPIKRLSPLCIMTSHGEKEIKKGGKKKVFSLHLSLSLSFLSSLSFPLSLSCYL